MSHIISVLPRHYIGTAAEIGGITGVCGDTAYETDTDIYKHWNGAVWLTGGIPYPVVRPAAAVDFTEAHFVLNGVWQVDGLDCSGIVPAGAIAIDFFLEMLDDAASTQVGVRGNAVTKLKNTVEVTSPAANVNASAFGRVACDANRLFDTYASAGIDSIDLTVTGWVMCRCL